MNRYRELSTTQYKSELADQLLDMNRESVYHHLQNVEFEEINGNVEQKINSRWVHKAQVDNVLVSEPIQKGGFFYFRMFTTTGEVNFDHESKHLQGILLLEVVRQAGIAACHLSGLPLEAVITLAGFDVRFLSYIYKEHPIYIRSLLVDLGALKDSKGPVCTFVQVFQNNKLCVEANVSGQFFKNRKILERLERMNSRACSDSEKT